MLLHASYEGKTFSPQINTLIKFSYKPIAKEIVKQASVFLYVSGHTGRVEESVSGSYHPKVKGLISGSFFVSLK